MLKNYLKIAFRNLFKQKAYSIINIAGLAVGMSCTVLIFLWVKEETNYDNFHENKEQIQRILINFESGSQACICGALGPAAKEEIPEILDYTRIWGGWKCQIFNNNNYSKEKGSFADPSFLTMFTFPMIEGDAVSALVEAHSIVITEKVAKKLFGDKSALGNVVQIKNRWGQKEDFKINGVIKDVPANSHIQFDFLFSFNLLNEWYRPDWAERWSNFSFFTYILVPEKSIQEAISKKVTACYNRHKETPRDLSVEPLKDVYLNAEVLNLLGPSGNSFYVKIFSFIAILILLIACINYMNLSTARAVKRVKEVALRKVIGANTKQILLQSFVESILLTLISLPVTLIMIELMTPSFSKVIGKQLLLDYMNYQFLLGLIIMVIVTGIISGIYPSFYIASFKPVSILKNRFTGAVGGNSFRKILVVFQFTLSIIIIISTLVTSSQMNFIQEKNLGFEKENIIYTWVPGKNNDVIRNELLKNSNIINVGASGAQLDWIGWWSGVNKWNGKEHDDYISFGILEVGYNYLDTYRMEMIDGRYYSKEFPADQENSIIVNESAVKLMNMLEPVGKTVHYDGKDKTIIGVVKDFHFQSLHEEIGPMFFVLYPQQLRCLGIRISGSDTRETMAYANKVLQKLVPEEKIELHFLEDQLDKLYVSDIRRGTLFSYFSLISIFIALLGLFGLAAYSVERRTKEIGIRKVLGASVAKIVSTLTKEFLLWVLIANIIAVPIAYYMMEEWLQGFAYRVKIDLHLCLMAGCSVLIITLFTVGYQTMKAALANPVESLRYE
jgi:putative ABC transport system permease protein